MVRANEIGGKLCEHFGLNPRHVRAISFNWRAGELATIDVEMIITGNDDFPQEIFQRYSLVEIETENDKESIA